MPQDLTDDKSTLVQVMAWCCQATNNYLNQCWPRPPTPYGVTKPQWVNSLWLGNSIWRHRSGSALSLVMACCLMALSRYLNQCWLTWLIINKVQCHSSEGNFTKATSAINCSGWNCQPWPSRSQNWMFVYFIITLSRSQQFPTSSSQNQVKLGEWATGHFMHCNCYN